MELLLIRHAIACERDAARWRNDDERPLSARGRARGRLAAAALGHEPGLSELLSVCLYGGAAYGAFGFKKMGAALVTFGGTVSAGRGRLVWFLPPRLLRAAR